MPKFYKQHVDYSLSNLILISVDTIIWMYLAAIQLACAAALLKTLEGGTVLAVEVGGRQHQGVHQNQRFVRTY